MSAENLSPQSFELPTTPESPSSTVLSIGEAVLRYRTIEPTLEEPAA